MNISPAITQTFHKSLLQLQKHSPTILTGAGILGLVGAGVLAAKATLKLEATLNEGEERLQRAKNLVEAGEEEQSLVTKAVVYNAVEVGKLYWKSTALATASVLLILSGQHILNKRNAALAVAYQGLQTAFDNYRKRVIEDRGEEADRDYRLGLRTETITENGKKVKIKTVDENVDTSEYLFSFGPENGNFTLNHEHNLFYLTAQQRFANDLLRQRGHVFLSEVLDSIGIERTPASIVTGWMKGDGDDEIDFGIGDMYDRHGYLLLDFNVDGTIFDKI